ncbi:hypothetical protein [Halopiger xanaduensis]|uniref:DUF8107 domain-containing protein n=1 Tax=Halopiger xanaduensis (strain DSM 18323 / JCM 14033 / SH-6) TaxID=797210 RepID=F8D8Q7_HALXS|nr:hypothetical protein [Halopiger xanaduensis]AEH36817.1 hypothetical protein Halxa_2192 [Halopiger xanaduensis SH-6]
MASDGERDGDGLQEGLESSQGDPRLLTALNAVLSTAFAALVLWGLDFIGAREFTLTTLAFVAVCLFVLTYSVVQT